MRRHRTPARFGKIKWTSAKTASVQSKVRRATAFALVATLALAAPSLGVVMAVPFALVAVVGRLVTEGPLFEVFARPSDRIAGELRSLTGFALAATGLALLTSLTGLPVTVFVATIVLIGYGNLAEQAASQHRDAPLVRTLGFVLGGSIAATAGQIAVGMVGSPRPLSATLVFLAVTGALVAALAREIVVERDDPLVLFSVALLLWLLTAIEVQATMVQLAIAIGIIGGFGYLSWAIGTASIPGMLTGVIIGLLTIVLGGYGWFAVLIAFFGLGGMATKFRYEKKRTRGVAEPNEGARGSRNVLGNAAVASVAVIGFAASSHLSIDPTVFLFAFTGSIATAMSDTLSSEIGVLFDRPRLITTLEEVEPGTDGGVTWQGELVGITGATGIAGLTALLLDIGGAGVAVIVVAGVVGMTVDSVLGAAFEGRWIGNQSVNFLATLAGAATGVIGAIALGLVTV